MLAALLRSSAVFARDNLANVGDCVMNFSQEHDDANGAERKSHAVV